MNKQDREEFEREVMTTALAAFVSALMAIITAVALSLSSGGHHV